MDASNHDANSTKESVERRVSSELMKHAVPDPRFHYDFSQFIPDFRGSSAATDHAIDLLCYRSARTILITADNSLEQLRYRALKDGKTLLVATHRIRRGFVILDPRRIAEDKYEYASCLDGMEKPGIGRHATLAQMQEEGTKVDVFILGSFAVSSRGSPIPFGNDFSRAQWFLLADREIASEDTPIITIVHESQIVDEEVDGGEHSIRCNFVITPAKHIEIKEAKKPNIKTMSFDIFPKEVMNTVPPLQELRGIKMMEEIMKTSGLSEQEQDATINMPSSDEKMGIDMVERIMKGYRV
jgi:5-formyltetrahydrofolate cyclo-ligase